MNDAFSRSRDLTHQGSCRQSRFLEASGNSAAAPGATDSSRPPLVWASLKRSNIMGSIPGAIWTWLSQKRRLAKLPAGTSPMRANSLAAARIGIREA